MKNTLALLLALPLGAAAHEPFVLDGTAPDAVRAAMSRVAYQGGTAAIASTPEGNLNPEQAALKAKIDQVEKICRDLLAKTKDDADAKVLPSGFFYTKIPDILEDLLEAPRWRHLGNRSGPVPGGDLGEAIAWAKRPVPRETVLYHVREARTELENLRGKLEAEDATQLSYTRNRARLDTINAILDAVAIIDTIPGVW